VDKRFVIWPQINPFSRVERPGRQFEALVTGLPSLRISEEFLDTLPANIGLVRGLWQAMGRQPSPYPIMAGNLPSLLLKRKSQSRNEGFLALDFFWGVLKGLSARIHKRELRLYHAIGSSVDYHYGVDLFFRCRDNNNLAISTIDLSQQYKPPGELKADFNLTEKEFEVGCMPEVAKSVACHLESQLKK
jgi:hypothetical protein